MNYTGFRTLIEGLGDGDQNTALEVRTLFNHILESICLPGDIKEIDCTEEYIIANFEPNGLGKNERSGWAKCNGLNGTKPRGGRTSICHSDEYPILGALGGAKTHKLTVSELPSHEHDIPYNTNDAGGNGNQRTLDNSGNATIYNKTKPLGGDQAHNNMQPYIVSFFIQKL